MHTGQQRPQSCPIIRAGVHNVPSISADPVGTLFKTTIFNLAMRSNSLTCRCIKVSTTS